MKITVQTSMRLSPIGWIGAGLLLGAPLLATFAIANQLSAFARQMRLAADSAPDFAPMIWIAAIGTAVACAGLVMVLVGREFAHQVEIDRNPQ